MENPMAIRPSLTRSLIALLISALVAVMSVGTAEAKRFGGGKSFGYQGQKSSQTYNQRQSTTQQKATRSPGAGMGGMLTGLAAGGLLAWLFMGGAFEGLQPMDLLVMVLLGIGVFLFIRHLRGASSTNRPAYASPQPATPQPATAKPNPQARVGRESPDESTHHRPGVRSGSLMDEFNFSGVAAYQPPSWFDETRFLGAARTHFTNLQLAWDANRMDEVREFVTPTLFRELVRERAALGDAENVTEVISLNVALDNLNEEDGDIVAAVRFTGRIREAAGADPVPLDETWLVRRALDDENSNWLIAGIRQND